MHSCTHEHSLNGFSRNLRLTFANILGTFLTMDFGRRNTQKYSFKDPKIEEMMSLILEIGSSTDFQKKYGVVVPLMKLRMKEGGLSTVVQFYDMLCWCFTFPDYQLMPILEEYCYLFGLPINDCVPFTGLEREPKSHEISLMTHLKKSEIEANMTTKGGIRGYLLSFCWRKLVISPR